MNDLPIAVYGATGHTGKFVLRELERRGCRALAIGRSQTPALDDGGRCAGEWRRASCDDPDGLDEALRGTRAVINCAGPFLDTAPSLIEAALRAGIHYFDVTAEQRSVRSSLATYHEEAIARGLVILPAMAFFGGLADLLAAEATRGARDIESIETAVALDYWHPTPGSRKTGDRNTARRLVVAGGRLAPLPRPAPARDWTFPEPFGKQELVAVTLAEIITISRHTPARNICSYMNAAPLRDIKDPRTPPPTASEPSGKSSQSFIMDVHAVADGRRTRIAATGHDIYAVTAPIVVAACLRVLESPPARGGAYAPAELFEASDFLAELAPHVRILQ